MTHLAKWVDQLTHLANRVEFGLADQPDWPDLNTITRFINPNPEM